jgi:murein DD-endopeptidase MepM/ murein hydrolase activator NlpD
VRAFLIGSALGVVLLAVLLVWNGTSGRAEAPGPDTPVPLPASANIATPPPAPAAPGFPGAPAVTIPSAGIGDITWLRGRRLLLPVEGIDAKDLHDSFAEARGARAHEAIDILAPRGTPVRAVDDGVVKRLFNSAQGGLTIYQFDPTATYCYYYAHLHRYAWGLKEGMSVRKADVIGYVGTTGNAPRDTPHLHFTIFKLGAEKLWWQGTPVNPFLVWALQQ